LRQIGEKHFGIKGVWEREMERRIKDSRKIEKRKRKRLIDGQIEGEKEIDI
jgi:hypothetical protein